LILLAGSGVGYRNFHFANWIDRHGVFLPE
jgi:hypothetical protein